ncbi:putative MFS transporter [Talaromyces proteolyticus]|uniref:MFS transporter n=1 Tax=Talaromyces proteolyticus TaxID=1131652 RepID=A0AAD4PU62_9EURO|nr:putative MFS transporter [Talaromyces proteolyticus]KAH8689802.1 putative MFS transporter [Talaromyces proteolyticus]
MALEIDLSINENAKGVLYNTTNSCNIQLSRKHYLAQDSEKGAIDNLPHSTVDEASIQFAHKWSSSYGRRPIFLVSFAIYTAFTLGCAFAPNWPVFLFFRFLQGCGAAAPQTVSNGLFSDIYPDLKQRGRAVTILGLTSNVGPLFGPIISGFVSSRRWNRQFWVVLAMAGVNWPMLLFMQETFAPVIQAHETGLQEARKVPNSKDLFLLLLRPVRITAEPLVFFTDLFILYQYIIFFLYFGLYPLVFRDTYNMAPGVSALMFLGTGVGAVLAIFIFLAWERYHSRAVQQGRAWAQREEYRRLPLACLGGPLFAISEFWLGWAARPSIHWIVPALSGIPLGIGIDLTFMALNNYLTDAYGIYSASATASSVVTRNILASIIIPLCTYPLYHNLGGLCCLMIPIPFVFLRWGTTLRARSPFCRQLNG